MPAARVTWAATLSNEHHVSNEHHAQPFGRYATRAEIKLGQSAIRP